ncbi:FCP1 homology domain [Trypanosoma melophagium]|uniref:FCP1 homology domain n=1 Tax=Trypanosoma melophagium TaxID=715481 RepID=UPI00351A39AC|nr:FCP1 homology domain [Trypanosoma melophagium]
MGIGCRVPLFLILDIDNTLLSACNRFSAGFPFTSTATFAQQQTLRYHEAERGQCMRACTITLRPHLREFLQLLDGTLSTSRVKVRVGLFTRNTSSYAKAIAEQVLQPLMRESLAFIFDGTHCTCGSERKKPLSVSPLPATSLLIDDSCSSFIADEFFSGRGALVQPFFNGIRPWSLEDEIDDVLSCRDFPFQTSDSNPSWNNDLILYDHNHNEKKGVGEDWCNVSLSLLLKEFVAFWHNNINYYESEEKVVNLLQDPRAARYRDCWYNYHSPMEERVLCIS